MRVHGSFAAALAVFACVVAWTASADEAAPPSLRLPTDVRPTHYDVALTVVPGRPKVAGRVAIDVDVDRAQSVVWLNAKRIGIVAIEIDGGAVRASLRNGNDEFIGLAFDPPLASGRHRLTLAYEADQNRQAANGIFTLEEAGAWYTMTQFEPVAARQALPCFDEPGFKVPWRVTLRVPHDLVALSNAPVQSARDVGDGMKEVVFEETRPLPAYLVAFAVGPFAVVDAGRLGDIPVRIVAPHGRAADVAFARQALPQILGAEVRWFVIPYPYAKLDHVAIPLGVRFAMENAGFITYGATALVQPGTPSAPFRHGLANVGAHEIAHQWFGDLVTMRWWDDVWLNEAFATWFAEKTVDAWQPRYEAGTQRVHARADAIEADALVGARRIRQPIETRGDIYNAFDAITYEKGATVIGMFEGWLGPETFRQGVRAYLAQHEDGNASAADFLAALQSAASKPVAAAFATFLDQNGVPQVSVDLDCSMAPARLRLAQRRHAALEAPGADRRWQIPVCARYGNAKATREACTLLTAATGTLPLEGACPTFVMANAGGRGYYVPEYRGKLWSRLMAKPGALTPAEATSVVYDLRPLLRAGAIDATQLLDGVRVGARSHERSVMTAAIAVAADVRDDLLDERERRAFSTYLRQAFAPRARALGFVPKPGESDDDALLRRELLRFAAPEDPPLAAKAQRLAREWLRDRRAIDPGIVDAVLVAAAQTADASLFEAMEQAALAAGDVRDRRNLMVALMSFREPALAARALGLLLDPRIDVREAMTALYTARDTAPRRVAYEFVVAHFDELAARVDPDAPAGWPTFARRLCSDDDRRDVEAFWQPRAERYAGAARNLALTLEAIDGCVRLRARERAAIDRYLGVRE